MRDLHSSQPFGGGIRKVARHILLYSAIVAAFSVMAQVSPGPALKGKGYPPDGSGQGTAQQLKDDAARDQARRLELRERIKRENAKRGIVPLSERMKPPGSNPAPSPGNPNPTAK